MSRAVLATASDDCVLAMAMHANLRLRAVPVKGAAEWRGLSAKRDTTTEHSIHTTHGIDLHTLVWASAST